MKPSWKLPKHPLRASDDAAIPPSGVLAASRGRATRRRLRPCLAGAGIRQPHTRGAWTAPAPFFIAVATAITVFVLGSPSAFAASGEDTPLNLKDTTGDAPAHVGGGGGSIVRTIVGLAVVIGVIYGLYWILKQVKSSREEKAVGQGLAALATLPLGPHRSLQLVRAGREIHLVGVSEHGVTPVRTYSEEEAEAAGLLDLDDDGDEPPSRAGGVLAGVVDDLRRRTVRR
jgi:flagellar protein FliO/FliZ